MSGRGGVVPCVIAIPRPYFDVPPTSARTLSTSFGGLYGNVEALHEILAMKARDERNGPEVRLLFNGDFNWFDIDDQSF